MLLLNANPDLLPRAISMPDESVRELVDKLDCMGKNLKEEELRQCLHELAERISADNSAQTELYHIKIGVVAIAALVLLRMAYDILYKMIEPIKNLERDKEKLEKMQQNTDLELQRYESQLRIFDELRLEIPEAVKRQFIDAACKGEWGMPENLQMMLHSDMKWMSAANQAMAIVLSGAYSQSHAENLWLSFAVCARLDFLRLIELLRKVKRPNEFLRDERRCCSHCGFEMIYDIGGLYIVMSCDGTYVSVRPLFFLCFQCERGFLRGLTIVKNVRI